MSRMGAPGDPHERCSHAVHQLLLGYTTSAEEIHKTTAQCDFCRLLHKVIERRLPKEMTTEPIGIRRKASKIIVQRGPHIHRLLTIRRLPGRKALNFQMIRLRRLTPGWTVQISTRADCPMISKSACLPCARSATLHTRSCWSHGYGTAAQITSSAARMSVCLGPKRGNTQRDLLLSRMAVYGWSIPPISMTTTLYPSNTSLCRTRGATGLSTPVTSRRRTPLKSTARPSLHSHFRTCLPMH